MSNLYPDHHVDMPLRVLLYHVTHVVRLLGLPQEGAAVLSSEYKYLLELSAGNKVLDLPHSSDGILMGSGEATGGE